MLYIISFLFISIFGALLHFAYDYSKHNKVVGLFSAVNESTWEHIKMGLTSYFIWMIVDGIKLGSNPNFWLAELVGALTIIIVIPLIFYGYQLFTKKPIIIVDIMSFFVAVGLAVYFKYLLLNANAVNNVVSLISIVLIFVVFGAYLLLTILPIDNFLFKDPLTNKYGFKGHKK